MVVTDSGRESVLRSVVVQRKVTSGYRAMWAVPGEAAVRTIVDTAHLSSANAFATLLKSIGV